ncbi:MAG: TenA family transcriptional regulator [Leptolyngbya sp. IPPAS B-1204]|nr:TenA family transcriptional regulator [Leptolyngbya sp. NK1-12]
MSYIMPLTCQHLIKTYPAEWQAATVHPFLSQCRTGQIHADQFNTWLVQDYLFVIEFTRMAARLLAAAPVDHFDTLLNGLHALQIELSWFRDKADERQLTLDTAKQPTCQEYCDYMASLATTPYAVQATAFWAIEYAYNQGWQLPGHMVPPYDEFADRWGNPGFTEYVELLANQANAALQDAPEDVQQQAEAAFLRIARLETDFWQMAYSA